MTDERGKTILKGDINMSVISMKQLLEAGVHFGHQTRRWNPKMKPYIFTERNGIHVIDLQKTVKLVDDAYNYVKNASQEGAVVLFNKERERLEKFIGSIADMPRIPDVMYIVDPHAERIAVKEAKTLGSPVVAMVDTNADPEPIDAVIPANDDAIRAVKLITAKIGDAIIEGRQGEDAAEYFVAEEAASEESLEELSEIVEGN